MNLLHMEHGIINNPQVTTEAEVLLVVGQEAYLYARIALNIQRIDNVETVEADCIAPNW